MLDTEAPEKDRGLIGDCLEMQSPIICSSPLWNKLTNSIFYFIAKDMQPYMIQLMMLDFAT